MTEILFYSFAFIAIISAFFILFTNNVLHAALALIITFLGVTALYVFAHAEFLAVTQIMIYVGGIVVLIIFGVMLTNKAGTSHYKTGSTHRFMGTLVAIGAMSMLIYGILKINFKAIEHVGQGGIEELGVGLMTGYVLPFELAAILLLVALIGAAVIAGQDLKNTENK
ncbi:MAG: NADH-quinone oxidoreductase subunit J [Cytophagales bacterium]|nr:NADH-quinone oxidoreductase subunit J [Cytophagales bacterium]